MSSEETAIQAPVFQFTFPPFPPVPPGVVIMPYKDFKERGILMEPNGDGDEIDSLGIPTVHMRVRHETDGCKTNTKRKWQAEEAKKKKKKKDNGEKIGWWEEWDEFEFNRFAPNVDPNATRLERIQAAAADFTKNRTWPISFASETGPKFIWEKFQRYIGITEGATVVETKKRKSRRHVQEISDDEMDDGEENENENDSATVAIDTQTGIIGQAGSSLIEGDNQKARKNEEKLIAFLTDPEKSLKIFMTSYSRNQGYIWADANLESMPRLLTFFINFLIRNKVFQELKLSFQRCLKLLEVALIELPATSKIARAIPDGFAAACKESWGQKAEGYTLLVTGLAPDEPLTEPGLSWPEEPEPKRRRTENEPQDGKPDAPEDGKSDALEDGKPDVPVVDGSWGTWGTTDCDVDSSENTWDIPMTLDEELHEHNPWASLDEAKKETLVDLLGPTAFPITHSTGVVERSMRRIVSIIVPSNLPAPPLEEGVTGPSPAAVEIELQRICIKVTLTPMLDWDGNEAPLYTRPLILPTSVGPVVDPKAPDTSAPASGAKPHNPEADDITVLMKNEGGIDKLLKEGMALGGTWVQLVRQIEAPKKKKKGKSKKPPVFWYLEELALNVPSFWEIPVA